MASDKAFSKDTDAQKLQETSEQYQDLTEDEKGKAEDAAEDVPEVLDQAARREQIEAEEKDAWESTPPSEPLAKAQQRAKDEAAKAKDEADTEEDEKS